MNEILLEYYAGRDKRLEKCEEYLKEIIKLIKAEDDAMNSLSKKNNTIFSSDNKWNKLLEKGLKEFFNIDDVCIVWNMGAINAFTIAPITTLLLPINNINYILGNHNALKMDICVYRELITKCNLNEKELMAVILHEAGHNFYFCPFIIIGRIMDMITDPVNFVAMIVTAFLHMSFKAIDDFTIFLKNKFPKIYQIFYTYNNIIVEIQQFINPIKWMAIPKIIAGYIKNQVFINPFSKIGGYGGEIVADSMAAKYGYGPEQATALKKLRIAENTVFGDLKESSSSVAIMTDLCQIANEIGVMVLLEPHPSTNQRAINMLKKLKSDLKNKEYPPEMEQDLKNEIARMEKTITNVNANANKKDFVQVRKGYYDFLNKITAGNTDLRQILMPYFSSREF